MGSINVTGRAQAQALDAGTGVSATRTTDAALPVKVGGESFLARNREALLVGGGIIATAGVGLAVARGIKAARSTEHMSHSKAGIAAGIAGALALGVAGCSSGGDGPEPEKENTAFEDQIVVRLREHADLSDEALLDRGPDRREAVWTDLVSTGEKTQAPVKAMLESMKADGSVKSYESLYLPNAIVVTVAKGKQSAVTDALQGVAEVEKVSENIQFSVGTDGASGSEDAQRGAASLADPSEATRVEWGVDKIGAPKAWAAGYDGTGVTVGVVDTGLDATHPAISGHYRGQQADGSVDHNYNWFDATSANKQTPYDDDQHGTHVAGTVAGGTSSRATGVAPGAKIIAAKGLLGSGYNTTVATMKALQWMLAPTDTEGSNPDPRVGADIVNNSWGSPDKNDRTFLETWDGLLAAGIVPVSAAGNDGPGNGTVHPPGSFPQGISVAATNSSDRVTSFSSRGPSPFDPKAPVPLIAAPGGSVTSAVPGGGYAALDGTSMASPHVAGAIAVLLQAKPNATYDEIATALTATATDIDAAGVDKASGYGRINVDAAVQYLLEH